MALGKKIDGQSKIFQNGLKKIEKSWAKDNFWGARDNFGKIGLAYRTKKIQPGGLLIRSGLKRK